VGDGRPRSRRARVTSRQLWSSSPERAGTKVGSNFRIDVYRRCHGLGKFQHADLGARSDVVLAVRQLPRSGCGEVGRRNVSDKDKVAGLTPVAVDNRPTPGEHPITEDRDHAGITAGILPGAIDVALPQRHHVQPAHSANQRA
jgi:hypothetical protein